MEKLFLKLGRKLFNVSTIQQVTTNADSSLVIDFKPREMNGQFVDMTISDTNAKAVLTALEHFTVDSGIE